MLDRARAMRRVPTRAEAKLWRALRAGALAGLKVRRQVPIGRYIVDFAITSNRLVIEVDGESHAGDPAWDELRTAWLAGQGWRVLRFTNPDILSNLEGVLSTLVRVVNPHPDPLPTGEGAGGSSS